MTVMKASLCLLEILNMVSKTADSINCGYTRTHLTPIIQKSKGKKKIEQNNQNKTVRQYLVSSFWFIPSAFE